VYSRRYFASELRQASALCGQLLQFFEMRIHAGNMGHWNARDLHEHVANETERIEIGKIIEVLPWRVVS
jgi:hypothetical protein